MKSILLIGLGRFGRHAAMQLKELGHEVMAIDSSETRVNDVLPYVTDAQIGDSTDERFLRSLGIPGYDVCIVAIGDNFQSSLETTSLLKDLGAKFVVARASRDIHAKFLLRNGADEVVYPEKQMARWTAMRFSANHMLDYFQLDSKNYIFEVEVPTDWIGKTVGNLNIRNKFGINILAKKVGDQMDLNIRSDTIFNANQTLLVLGEYKALNKCFHFGG